MAEPFRVAVIGAGYFSQFHLEAWRAIPGVELVGLCDSDSAKARARADRYGIARVFADPGAMLDALRPDLVDIVTPPASHASLVALAAQRGVRIVCQKPLAPSYREAMDLVGLAEEPGVPLVVHENFRFMPWYREARRLIDSGTVGTLHAIAFRLRPGDGQGPRAYLERQPYFQTMPRFLVYETAIHYIDTFRFLMGEVIAVYARLRRMNPAVAGEDAGYIVFEFANSATGLFDGNRLNDHPAANPRRTMGEMWLEGSSGVLRLDGEARLWWKGHGEPESAHEYERGTHAFGGGACEALQRHVVRHFLDGTPLENRAADYLENLRVQEAVYRSHAEGRRIVLADFDPVA
ncbi:MAG TPA: Gfo/Idh/MocA family oxidoreductase [Burkholderiales bacterium]|nr:Gfo/Idh/MocA family oxidoreductase [Burkholderiales bacterium]